MSLLGGLQPGWQKNTPIPWVHAAPGASLCQAVLTTNMSQPLEHPVQHMRSREGKSGMPVSLCLDYPVYEMWIKKFLLFLNFEIPHINKMWAWARLNLRLGNQFRSNLWNKWKKQYSYLVWFAKIWPGAWVFIHQKGTAHKRSVPHISKISW